MTIKKAPLFALTAIFFYATSNVLVDKHLKDISPIINVAVFCISILALALPCILMARMTGQFLVSPNREQIGIIVVCGCLTFFADYCYFKAYNSNGNLIMITTITALFPVIASVMKAALGGGWPTAHQFFGTVLAVAAILLVSKN